jgi:hypothetical protein
MSKLSICILLYFMSLYTFSASNAFPGVTNPDISVMGQLYETYTDDNESESGKKPSLSLGETEVVLDSALNPYLKGTFVFSIDEHEGIEVEEAYADIIRGLPYNLAIKAGKYRLNFGNLNAVHPHAYPFIRTPHVLDPESSNLLPGEESFNDTAVETSILIPVSSNWTTQISADILQGNSYHPEAAKVRNAWLAHIENSFMAGPAPVNFGMSCTEGVNNIDAYTKTSLIGANVKTKIPCTLSSSITIAGEYFYKLSKIPDPDGNKIKDNRYGFYFYSNMQMNPRYNAGVLYEQYLDPIAKKEINRSVKPFIGFSVLEESTIIRLSYERFMTKYSKDVNTIEMQFLFSMGPHKAHKF